MTTDEAPVQEAILRAHLPDLGWTQAVRLLGEALGKRLNLREEPEPGDDGPDGAPVLV